MSEAGRFSEKRALSPRLHLSYLSIFLQEEPKPEETLYLYETDKILAERNKKYIN